jgi:hypothetical protein
LAIDGSALETPLAKRNKNTLSQYFSSVLAIDFTLQFVRKASRSTVGHLCRFYSCVYNASESRGGCESDASAHWDDGLDSSSKKASLTWWPQGESEISVSAEWRGMVAGMMTVQ